MTVRHGSPDNLPGTLSGFIREQVAARPYAFSAFAAAIVSAAGVAVAVQYGMKLLVDAMAAPEQAKTGVFGALFLFLGLIAIESVLWRLGGVIGSRTIIAAGIDIRIRLFAYLTGHSMRFFSTNLSGALGNRITATASNFGLMAGTFAWSILPPCVDFLGALIIFSTIEPMMAGALAGAVLFIGGMVAHFGLRGRPLHRNYSERSNWASGELVDVVTAIWPVKAFAARNRELKRLSGILAEEAAAHRKSWFHLEKVRMAHDIGLLIMAGGMLAWAILLWNGGSITAGDVVVISALTFRILHGSRDLAMAATGMANNLAFIQETLQIVGSRHEIADRVDAVPLVRKGGDIRFCSVTFGYDEHALVFDRLSLHIPAGQHVGIVGPSGSGKSTLIALLQRLYEIQDGEIRVDGQDIRGVTQDSLRSAIAVVPQDCLLFHRTILDNIRYAQPHASDEDVVAAARAARCDPFIAVLPNGYNTIVGERGVHLSGGQRQRIAIARAILAQSDIVLLDEATSALDSISEHEVQTALDRLLKGRTVIVAAHRLATLAACDRILVFDQGRLVEDGSPRQLLAQEGVFRNFWERQSLAHGANNSDFGSRPEKLPGGLRIRSGKR